MRLETHPITARSFEKDYFIDGEAFERAYKLSISGFSDWPEALHAEDCGNKAFNDIAAAMFDREDEILNYFVHRSTNAAAESLNAKIKPQFGITERLIQYKCCVHTPPSHVIRSG